MSAISHGNYVKAYSQRFCRDLENYVDFLKPGIYYTYKNLYVCMYVCTYLEITLRVVMIRRQIR